MRVLLTGRNVDITPSIRQLLDRKLQRVERLLNDSALSAQVVLTAQRHQHITDISLHARGDHVLSGMGDDSSWPRSMGQAVERITQQAHKLKEKWHTRRRRAAGVKGIERRTLANDTVPVRRAESETIVRRSRYPVKPMSVEDAALRLESTSEAFLVFRNATTDGISILYRRKDGRLGVIEPDA